MIQRKTFIRGATTILLSLGAASALILERVIPTLLHLAGKAI